jgi:AcrR family transcriptional regulator
VAEAGMTLSNLIHYFGSAAELQSTLMGTMVRDLAAAIGPADALVRSNETAPHALVEIFFDALDKGGSGMLAAWIDLPNKHAHLLPSLFQGTPAQRQSTASSCGVRARRGAGTFCSEARFATWIRPGK